MFTDLFIYLPFLVLALIDFAFFGKVSMEENTPTFFKNSRHTYDIELAGRREASGYGAS